MFGSLVVVFPTEHEGGELALCPRDAEETTVLDFGALLSKEEEPSIGYAAFFSDVTHEVYEVKRGPFSVSLVCFCALKRYQSNHGLTRFVCLCRISCHTHL